MTHDAATARAFATSWNSLPPGSVYTAAQFADWMTPLTAADVEGKSVLELGCGNGSLLVHMTAWRPRSLVGIDLGDSVLSARDNLRQTGFTQWRIEQHDLVSYRGEPADVVYCIGVLHHLQQPRDGFESVLDNTKPGGRFHCWVYAKEGNTLVRWLVDPLRRVACRLPWWLTKYGLATPLAMPLWVYARLASWMPDRRPWRWLPLFTDNRIGTDGQTCSIDGRGAGCRCSPIAGGLPSVISGLCDTWRSTSW